jgi:hypothetical protein
VSAAQKCFHQVDGLEHRADQVPAISAAEGVLETNFLDLRVIVHSLSVS